MGYDSGSVRFTGDTTGFPKFGSNGKGRVLLREPERCPECAGVYLSLYPLSDCPDHEGLDKI